MRTGNKGGLTLLLLISLSWLLRGRGQRPAGGPGGRDSDLHLQATERFMAWVSSSRSSWSKATPFPPLPALLPTHDFKAQGYIHFADGNRGPERAETCLRSHSQAVAEPCLFPCSLLSPTLLPQQGPLHILAVLGK